MFQVKNLNSIVASMINNVNALSSELTDFNIGSKNRTILEAVARELDQYYQNFLKGIYEAIPVAIYKSFVFGRQPASQTSGYVTFTRVSGTIENVSIPEGTQVRVPNTTKTYATNSAVTIAAGEDTIDAFVVATVAGSDWNVAADTITELVSSVTNVASVTNASSFSNGSDEESDYERKLRFQLWVSNLARATRTSIEYGAKLAQITDDNGVPTEIVDKVLIHEPCIDDDPAGDVGIVNVYLWNGVDGASTALRAEVKKILLGYTNDEGEQVPGWKGAGIIVYVYEVEADTQDLEISIETETGYTVDSLSTEINQAVDDVFSALEIGENLLISRLIDSIMDVLGVNDVQITTPVANVVADWNHILIKGDVTLSAL